MQGGYRQGAGRKPGFSAKSAEEARRYLSARVAEEIGSLADSFIKSAKEGDIRAIRELLDRAWGRPRQEIQLSNKEAEAVPSEKVMELANKLNGVVRREETQVLG